MPLILPPRLPMYARGHNQQDTFGLTLAAQLREVCDPSFRLTSGANRQIRQLGTPLTQFVNPRSEGRVIVATRGAERVVSLRGKHFSRFSRAIHPQIGSTNVSGMPGMTLYIGRYLFIIHKQEVVLARVITMYSKAGSNAGKHEYVLDLPSIGSPSYIVVRLHSPFELFGVGIFSDVACSSMSSPTFLQIRPNEVLLSLGGYLISRLSR